jgi:type IV secretion system protein VirB5
MHLVRRIALQLCLVAGLFGAPVAKAGIPVIDAANLAQAITDGLSWIQQAEQMVQQIQQLADQLRQMEAMTGKLDLARSLGSILNDPQIRQLLPEEMRHHEALGSGGPYGGQRLQSINTLLSAYGITTQINGAPLTAGQTSADALLKMQAVLASVQHRTGQVDALAGQVDTSADAKSSLDLLNRNLIEATRVSMDTQQALATIEANRQAERLRRIAATQQGMAELKAKAQATREALGF